MVEEGERLGRRWGVFVVVSLIIHSNDFIVTGKSKEAERKRINKELANIRSKFKGMWCVKSVDTVRKL